MEATRRGEKIKVVSKVVSGAGDGPDGDGWCEVEVVVVVLNDLRPVD